MTTRTSSEKVVVTEDAGTQRPSIAPEEFHVNGHKRVLCVIGLALVLFISVMDTTIVSVALPVIGAEFNDFRQASWIVTAYLLTYTAFLPIISKLTDIVGRRPILIFSTLFFMLWSGACGGAKSMMQLIIFRAIQGIGGSAIFSSVIVTMTTMVPRHQITKITPVIGAVFASSSVAGPLIGGVIVSHTHWGWIFFVNLPIGAVGAGLILYSLSDPYQGRLSWSAIARRVDWGGSIVLFTFSILLTYALQVGGTPMYPWVSAKVLTPLLISVLLLPPFFFLETRHPEPLVPLRLFAHRNFTLAIIFSFFLGAAFYTLAIFLPQRMQIATLLSPITSGVRMMPLLILVGVLSPIAGALVVRTRSYRPLIWFASSLGGLGAGLLSTVTIPTNFTHQYGFEAIAGISIGVTITVSTMVVQFSVGFKDIAVASGFQSFIRQLGALVGIAESTAILNSRVTSRLAAFAIANPGSSLASEVLRNSITQDPAGVLTGGMLDAVVQAAVQEAYSEGFSKVFVGAAVWFAVAALVTYGLVHQYPIDISVNLRKNVTEIPAEESTDVDVELGRFSKLPPVDRSKLSQLILASGSETNLGLEWDLADGGHIDRE